MTYTSGPTATADKPWQVGATTPQIEYRSVQLFDLFLKYKLFEHTELNASLQNLTDRYYLDPLAQSFARARAYPAGGDAGGSEPPSPPPGVGGGAPLGRADNRPAVIRRSTGAPAPHPSGAVRRSGETASVTTTTGNSPPPASGRSRC